MLALRTTGVATAVLIFPCSGIAYAATWSSSVSVPSTVEYDSNPTLLSRNEKGVTRYIIAPNLNLVGTSGPDEYQVGLGVNVVRSSDTNIVSNREDPRLKFGWQRETETGAFGLTARYEESSTLSSTVQDTGVVSPDATQTLYGLAGNWRTALSERSTLLNETEFNHVTYDINSLTDYDELSNRLSYTYAWSDRMELFTRLGLKRYEPDTGSTGSTVGSSNSYTPDIGMNYQFSDRFRGSVYVGANEISGTNSGPSAQGGLTLNYSGDRVEASIDAGRTTLASGDGGFVEVDSVRGSWSYLVDETRRTGIDASWQDTKGQTPNTLNNYSAWFDQELSPFWIARLSYTYKQRQQVGLPDATANVVGLTLTYSYPGL
ncbi:hypothetical protein NTD84_15535 [Pseudomonas sp. 14P_8.1_Bac3]|uniref:hypothetical protein n=1 Tax=Pseudomonas sp. 14P_8.1_Bac3 TaxID=2971621 RepID=UPI0021CA446A|nr:hypothetical protein [Pseudomonas sp. 14P_8.1_Bac3]MCU1761121.1 hypothetical protein [Pseudomonas sp. 14P_8.1_Bac3]